MNNLPIDKTFMSRLPTDNFLMGGLVRDINVMENLKESTNVIYYNMIMNNSYNFNNNTDLNVYIDTYNRYDRYNIYLIIKNSVYSVKKRNFRPRKIKTLSYINYIKRSYKPIEFVSCIICGKGYCACNAPRVRMYNKLI